MRGTLERAEFLLDAAPDALAATDLADSDKPGFHRFVLSITCAILICDRYIVREPLGVVLVIAPWK